MKEPGDDAQAPEHDALPDDEEVVARMIRSAGRGPMPSADAAARVRAAVEGEFDALAARRRRRRLAGGLALAASLLLGVGLMLGPGMRELRGPAPIAGTLARTAGPVRVERDGRTLDAAPGMALHAGDAILGQAAFRLAAAGAEVRTADGSRVRLTGAAGLDLDDGALYLETPGTGTGPGLEVRAGALAVRDIGTRFSVRRDAATDHSEVAIRRGEVRVTGAAAPLDLRADGDQGRRVTLAGGRVVADEPVPSWSPQWDWAGALAPALVMDGRSLARVLTELADRRGQQLEFASDRVRLRAETTRMNGRLEGFAPDAAVAAVLASTDLVRADAPPGVLRVELRDDLRDAPRD